MKWVADRTGRFAKRPHYLPDELDTECEQVITKFLKDKYGNVQFPVKTDDLAVLIEQKASIDSYADLSDEGGDVEGVTEFRPGKRPLVKIARFLSLASNMENRLRTTLAHEYGHVHFHEFLFATKAQTPSLFLNEEVAQSNKCKRDNIERAAESDWMEWQAGYVCGALLMPMSPLVATVKLFRGNHNLPFSSIVLNSDQGKELVATVATAFQTSRDASRVRLLKKGILTDSGSSEPGSSSEK